MKMFNNSIRSVFFKNLTLLKKTRSFSITHSSFFTVTLSITLFALSSLSLPVNAGAESFAYVNGIRGDISKIDLDSGIVTTIGKADVNYLYDIAMSPSGELYGVGQGKFYSINKDTAEATLIKDDFDRYAIRIEFGTNGLLYTTGVNNYFYVVDTTTGILTNVGNLGSNYQLGEFEDIVTFDDNMYLVNSYGLWIIENYTRCVPDDPCSYAAERINWTTADPLIASTKGLAMTLEGTMWGFNDRNLGISEVFQITHDVSTGTVTGTIVHEVYWGDPYFDLKGATMGVTIIEPPQWFNWLGPNGYTDDPSRWYPHDVPGTDAMLRWETNYVIRDYNDTMRYRVPDSDEIPHFLSINIGNSSPLLQQEYGWYTYFEHPDDTLMVGEINLGTLPHLGLLDYDDYERSVIWEMGKTGENTTLKLVQPLWRLEGGIFPTLSVGHAEESVARFFMYSGDIDSRSAEYPKGNGAIYVGNKGIGRFYQGGGEITIANFIIGHENTSNGEYVLENGELNTQFFDVGFRGYGIARLEEGTINIGKIRDEVPFGQLRVGYEAYARLYITGNLSINPAFAINESFIFDIRHGRVYDSTSGNIIVYKMSVGSCNDCLGEYIKSGSGILRMGRLEINEISSFHQSAGTVSVLSHPHPNLPGIVPGVLLVNGEYTISDGFLKPTEIVLSGQLNVGGGQVVLLLSTIPDYPAGIVINPTGEYRQTGGRLIAENISNSGAMTINPGIIESSVFENQSEVYITGGSVFLDGDYNQLSGITIVNGTLQSDGNVNIIGGYLGGEGEIIGNLIISDTAQVNPGDSPGTLFVDGDFTLEEGATLVIEIGPGDIDRIAISGSYNLFGRVLFKLLGGIDFSALQNYQLSDFFLRGTSKETASGISDVSAFTDLIVISVTDGLTEQEVAILEEGLLAYSYPDDADPDGDGFFIDDNCFITANPTQVDTDFDSLGDACDYDDDNDGVIDNLDNASLDPQLCTDIDGDTCDDCSANPISAVSATPWPLYMPDTNNDGIDTDGEGSCNTGDSDDDNDGVADESDASSLDPQVCEDIDLDTCDDCSGNPVSAGSATPWALYTPNTNYDGVDIDGDGICESNFHRSFPWMMFLPAATGRR